MKGFLLLVALLGASSYTSAQVLRPAARPDSLLTPLAASPAAPDTAMAIHQLFVARRKRQGYATGATAIVAIGTLIALTSSQPAQTSGSRGTGFGVIAPNDLGLLVAAFVTLPLIPVVAIGFGGWSPKGEQQALAEWRRHQLPRHLRRQLKIKYFQ